MNAQTQKTTWKKSFPYLYTFLALMCYLGIFTANAQSTQADTTVNKQSAVNPQVSVIILLRHAEKGDDGTADPPLSEKGIARAETLADLLAEVPCDLLYTTPYKRTAGTIEPLARKHNIQVRQYHPTNPGSIEGMLQSGKGKCMVVVGHSNTIPALANRLVGSNKFSATDESDYGKIWYFVFESDRLVHYSILNY
jgi:2,3-bisphosphoglycerate-dependent phosphoglycerate mutase